MIIGTGVNTRHIPYPMKRKDYRYGSKYKTHTVSHETQVLLVPVPGIKLKINLGLILNKYYEIRIILKTSLAQCPDSPITFKHIHTWHTRKCTHTYTHTHILYIFSSVYLRFHSRSFLYPRKHILGRYATPAQSNCSHRLYHCFRLST